jgi:hypothetical protein
MAVDLNGNAVRYNGSSWSNVLSVDPGGELRSVSCISTSLCAAVDNEGNVMLYDGTSWSSAESIDQGVVMNSVSCSSSSFCAATDNAGDAVDTSSTTQTSSSSVPSATARSQAATLTALLKSSSADRFKLQNSVDLVQSTVQAGNGCGAGMSTAVANLQQVAANRQGLLNQLSGTPLSLVPGQQRVLADLRSAWLISKRIDTDFERWASTELNNGCMIGDSQISNYVATETLDPRSTDIKTRFVNVWNPIARQLNQPSHWTADQI